VSSASDYLGAAALSEVCPDLLPLLVPFVDFVFLDFFAFFWDFSAAGLSEGAAVCAATVSVAQANRAATTAAIRCLMDLPFELNGGMPVV
jgi:hypothetical protein